MTDRPLARRRRSRRDPLRRKLLMAAALPLIVAANVVLVPILANAVDATGQFAMDGTIAEAGAPSATPPFHWADLFDKNGNALITHATYPALLGSAFVPDYVLPDPSYFTSDKDTYPIANWGCKTQNTATPKDDLQNAYIAVFQTPKGAPENGGDIVAYMGVERLTQNGDAFSGFWLFKDPTVSCTNTGASTSFTGHHTDGDILILTNFTNGGTNAGVSVYRWTGTDAAGSPKLITLANGGGTCGAANGNNGDTVCAISNSVSISSPWAPWNNTTQIPSPDFTEAAIDLTKLFGGTASGPCFSNFLAETRSSQQLSATLKDFAGANINTCVVPKVTSLASGNGSTNLPGSSQTDTASVNGGAGNPTPTGSLTFFLCSPSQTTAAGCPKGNGTQVGSAVTMAGGSATSTPPVTGTTAPSDLTIGTYCWGAQYTPDANSLSTYLPSYGTDASNECFNVAKASPTTGTTSQIATGTSSLSSSPTLSDTATLTNMATDPGGSGAPAGEPVAFSLWGPYATGVTPTCQPGASEPVFTTTGALAGGGTTYSATTSSTYTVTAVGTYVWTTAYAGDAWNSPSTEGCNGAGEAQTISTPALSITKTADAATVSAGTDIGFTVTVSNSSAAGTGTATGVTINDPLPAGGDVNWAIGNPAYTGPGTCTISGGPPSQVLKCSGITLNPGDSATVHVFSTTDANSCQAYNNTATASATNITGQNPTAMATTTVQCPDVTITKTADAASVSAGSDIGFTVTVSNSATAGTGTATGVTINDPLPAGTDIDWMISPAYTGAGSCSITGAIGSQVLKCSIGSMLPGATDSVHITSTTDDMSCAQYTNTASANVTNQPVQPTNAMASTTVQCPGLNITKTADATPVSTGATIGFTITVSNSAAAGTGTAMGVTINDPLPAGTGVDWMISPAYSGAGSCSITGPVGTQVLKCSLGNMSPGASDSVHISSVTTAASAGTYPNTASASASNAPTVMASAQIVVLAPDVTINKTADAATVDAGSNIGFTVTVNNSNAANTGTAANVMVTDPLPSGTGVLWAIDTQTLNGNPATDCSVSGAAGSQSLSCTIASMAPGDTYVVHITSTTVFASCATYNNMAQVSASNQVASPSAGASTTVQCPDLSITKTADAPLVSAGTPIGFVVTVSNAGPGTALGVAVNDPLPAGGSVSTGIVWSIASQTAAACTITGTAPNQSLVCAIGTLGAGSSYTVHITSPTSPASSGTYMNTATATATNAPTVNASATTAVDPPSLTFKKTADAAQVGAGNPIGFTMSVSNSAAAGTGSAFGVGINDPLPFDNGVDWSISPAYTGPGTCTINGSAPSQTLVCTIGTLAPGASASVHVTSATTITTCQVLDNTATLTASNAPSQTAAASITMVCGSVQAITTPATGAGTILSFAAAALVVAGFLLLGGLQATRRRRSAR